MRTRDIISLADIAGPPLSHFSLASVSSHILIEGE